MSAPRRWKWKLARRSSALLFLALLSAGAAGAQHFALGGMTAVDWFGVLHLVDPLAALENLLARREFQGGVLLGAGLLIAFAALFAGRAFCAWICPLGLLLDLEDSLRKRFRPHARYAFRGPRALKYWLLLFVLVLSLSAGIPLFQTLSPINVLSWLALYSAAEPGSRVLLGSMPLLLLVGLEWWLPRFWCRILCPLGAFYSWVGRWGRWRIRIVASPGQALACRRCSRACAMGIAVMEDHVLKGESSIDDPECTRCGDCVECCPEGRLRESYPC